ncbi:MAG: radical SAM peptide maturase [Candidatus Azobacteroides sp.]|nr:radical SAM peptide maturase [Candidatus Azobacteroides sp.]
MLETLIHTTENNNLYLYDDLKKLSLLIHPELAKVHEKSNNINSYYYKKYIYLKKYGFFSKSEFTDFQTISEAMVKDSLIQITQIVFEVTNFCNLNCTYCVYGELYDEYDASYCKNLNIDDAIKLLKYIFNLFPQNKKRKLAIGFFGGEPLLGGQFIKQVVDVVNQLKCEKKVEIEYNMTSNATLLHKYIDFLAANKFQLLISLDGNEVNHSYRVLKRNKKNSFHTVIENLDMIQRDYSEYFLKHVTFNAVLHDRNSVKEIYEFIYKRYNKIPRISELNRHDINPDKKNQIGEMFRSKRRSENEYINEDSDILPEIHEVLSIFIELSDFLKNISINSYISNITFLLHNVEKYLPTSTCLPFAKKIFLSTHNEILPCEKIDHRFAIGKMNNKVEIDICQIAQQYNFYFEHFKKFCQTCYAYRFCGACMFQMKNIDNIEDEEFVCENFYDHDAFILKLHRIFSFLEKYPNDFSEILENLIIE